MKNQKYVVLIALFILLVSTENGIAQETIPDMPLALSYAEDELPDYLSSNERGHIANRLALLSSASHFIASGQNHNFGIYPRIDIIEEATIEGLRVIRVVKLELSVNIRQVEGGISFGSYYWTISGSGNSSNLALKSAFNTLPRTDPKFTTFLGGIRSKLNAYYIANCASIIQKADQYIITNQYEEAILELVKVPTEAGECSDRVQEKLQNAYDEYQRIHCGPMLQQAKALTAQRKTNEALDVLLRISPNSSCSEEANRLIGQIGGRISQANQAKLSFAQEMYRYKKESELNQQQLRLQRWLTVAEIAKTVGAAAGVFTPSINFPIHLGGQ